MEQAQLGDTQQREKQQCPLTDLQWQAAVCPECCSTPVQELFREAPGLLEGTPALTSAGMPGACIPLCEQQAAAACSCSCCCRSTAHRWLACTSGIGRPHWVATCVCVMLHASPLRTAKSSQSILVVAVALCFERSWNLGTPWFCMHLLRPAEMRAVCVGTVDSRGGRRHRSTPPTHVVGC